eukprot:tig00000237_g20480.t1
MSVSPVRSGSRGSSPSGRRGSRSDADVYRTRMPATRVFGFEDDTTPRADVRDYEHEVCLHTELPGSHEMPAIGRDGDYLVVRSRIQRGHTAQGGPTPAHAAEAPDHSHCDATLERRFHIPGLSNASSDDVLYANLRFGILEVHIPKAELIARRPGAAEAAAAEAPLSEKAAEDAIREGILCDPEAVVDKYA